MIIILHPVPGLIGINDVSCGQHHTIALTSSGQILTWGDNKYGQLGLDYNQRKLMRHPVQVQSNELNPSSTTHTGWTHSAVLDGTLKTLHFIKSILYFDA